MSSQPTGDTPGSAVSASQTDEGGAPEPETAPAGAANPAGVAFPAGFGVPAQAAATGATAGTTASTGTTADAGTTAGTGTADVAATDACATTMLLDPDPGADPSEPGTGHSAEPGRREPVSKLAVVALVTGVLALVPISVACAIAALVGIGRTGRRGHGMAIAALFASATWVIMGSAVGTVATLSA